jgi:hypothetical protein
VLGDTPDRVTRGSKPLRILARVKTWAIFPYRRRAYPALARVEVSVSLCEIIYLGSGNPFNGADVEQLMARLCWWGDNNQAQE